MWNNQKIIIIPQPLGNNMDNMAPHTLINIPLETLDSYIYRIFSIERLLELRETSKNVLVHPSLWDDPFENCILNSLYRLDSGETITLAFRDHVFGQCWTSRRESDAMWRIYSPNKDGVRVRTTIRKLIMGLRSSQTHFQDVSCFIGKVSYLPKKKLECLTLPVLDATGHSQAKSLLFKRT